MGKFGFSFSWKRALGITAVKQKFARETAIPTSVNGIERKVGRSNIKRTGWVLFILLMMPFLLLLMAEPSMADDEPQFTLDKILIFGWLGLLSFSALLIIVGKCRQKKSNFRK